jgi:uncharacterized membrane protein YhhN
MNTPTLAVGQWRSLDAGKQRLLRLSALCSAAYFVTKAWQPFPGSVALKALSIAPLAALAFRSLRGPEQLLLGGALACSCLGDIFLDLRGDYFVQGLGSFLLAQLLYIALFARNWPRPLRLTRGRLTALAAVLLLSFGLTAWLWPGLGKLAAPVLFYIGALTAMVAAALLAGFKQRWIVWGALLFMLSDSLIGINKFKLAVPLRDHLVWATYYLGQCGIALGYLRERTQQD